MSDPTLLALVVDDPLAPKVLACWKALQLDLTDANTPATQSQIALLVQGDLTEVTRTLTRCQLAGLLVNKGVSPIADSWLSAYIGTRLGRSRKPTDKPSKAKQG